MKKKKKKLLSLWDLQNSKDGEECRALALIDSTPPPVPRALRLDRMTHTHPGAGLDDHREFRRCVGFPWRRGLCAKHPKNFSINDNGFLSPQSVSGRRHHCESGFAPQGQQKEKHQVVHRPTFWQEGKGQNRRTGTGVGFTGSVCKLPGGKYFL